MSVLYSGNNANRIVLKRVRDPALTGYVSDMTGTITLYDQTGTPVANAIDLPIVYTPGDKGEYRATIPTTAKLSKGSEYKVKFVSTNYAIELTKIMKCIERTG